MFLIRRLTSSQVEPTRIKDEPKSDPIEPESEVESNDTDDLELQNSAMEGQEEVYEHGGDGEDIFEGFDDAVNPEEQLFQDLLREEEPSEEPAKAPRTKAKAKSTKKKGKRKGKKVVEPETQHEAEEDELETPDAQLLVHDDAPRFNMEHQIEEEPMPQAQSEQARTANGVVPRTTRRSKPQNSTANDNENFEEDYDDENDGMDAIRLLNEAREQRNLARAQLAKSDIVPELEPESVLEASALPPRKIEKVKRVSTKRLLGADSASPQGDDEDPADIFDKTLTPAPASHGRQRSDEESDALLAQAMKDIYDIPITSSAEANEESMRPSKKALGKRRAVDEPKGSSRKRTRLPKDRGQNRDIRSMGTLLQGNPQTKSKSLDEDVSAPRSHDVQDALDIADEPSLFITSPVRPEITATYKVDKPSSTSGKSRKSRSSWNAINVTSVPLEDDSDGSNYQPDPDASEAESQQNPEPFPQASPEPVIPTSNGRSKRRLPVDEPDPSTAKPKNKNITSSQKPQLKTPKTPVSKAKSAASASTSKRVKLDSDAIEKISEAVENYGEMNDLSQEQVNKLIQMNVRSEEAKDLWKTICEEVAWIPNKTIHEFCRRKYHNFVARGKWTEEQDEELRAAYRSNPNKWTVIGLEINRFPEDARDRWRNYVVNGDNMRKDAWDKKEEERLSIAVEEVINLIKAARQRSRNRLFVGDDEELIDWNKVSEKMGHTRSRLQCSYKWKQLKKRQNSDDEDEVTEKPIGTSWRLEEANAEALALSASEKLRLLQVIRASGAGQEGKVPWTRVRDEFGGRGKRMTLKLIFSRLKDKISGHEGMKFQEILDELIDAFEASVPEEPDGFDVSRPAKIEYRRKSGSQLKANKQVASDNDNGEGSRTASGQVTGPKKFRERMRKQDESTQETELNENENSKDDTLSVNRKRKVADGTKPQQNSVNGIVEKGKIQAVKKKLRARSGTNKGLEPVSETPEGEDTSEGESLITALKSIKANKTPKARAVKKAKTPLRASKRSQVLSEKVVVEDASDDEVMVNGHVHQNGDRMKMGRAQNTTGAVSEQQHRSSEDELDSPADKRKSPELEDFDRTITANGYHLEDQDEIDAMNGAQDPVEDDAEDEVTSSADRMESPSLDDVDRTITTNGYRLEDQDDVNTPNGAEEQLEAGAEDDLGYDHHDAESVDLDAPSPDDYEEPLGRHRVPVAFGSQANGFRHFRRSASSDSLSSDASSIPAQKQPSEARMASVEL